MDRKERRPGDEDWPPRRAHWEQVYRDRAAESVSWFQTRPTLSLSLIEGLALPPDAAIIDVGGGASRLVDGLLEGGHRDLTVLDISAAALRASRERTAGAAAGVHWIEGDVLTFAPPRRYALWHDRALFHFFTRDSQRQAYARVLAGALATGGHAIIATFAADGPERCSGLPTVRYDAAALLAELGRGYTLLDELEEDHLTPAGAVQRFTYFLLRRD